MTVYKYPLQITDRQSILMPVNAVTLSVQMYNGQPALWALVDPLTDEKERSFVIVGTGNPAPDDIGHHRFVGTVQDRQFVWHVFEIV